MSKDTGGPAFPLKEPLTSDSEGMTLRDYFAAKAMQAMIGTSHESKMRGYAGWREEFTRESYRYADAMLEARK